MRSLGLLAVALAGTAMIAGCGTATPPVSAVTPSATSGASPAASPTALPTAPPTPTPTPPAGVTPFACAAAAGGSAFAGGGPRPSIVDVRVGDHGTYERVVVEFTSVGLPRYAIEPNPTTPPGGTSFTESARGGQVVVLGSYGFLLKIEDLDWLHDSFADGRDLRPGFALLKEVRVVDDFEAVANVGLGLARPVCPTVSRLDGPPRLVIDFPKT